MNFKGCLAGPPFRCNANRPEPSPTVLDAVRRSTPKCMRLREERGTRRFVSLRMTNRRNTPRLRSSNP
ncbi:hypothetical protein SF83666_b58600 (plasmid) [Sinorhizobium fredii CCBAU 83666]|nr:hypothetical protein SF83666_b58600 [Sinorhizobium fredii CCBAU 83666]